MGESRKRILGLGTESFFSSSHLRNPVMVAQQYKKAHFVLASHLMQAGWLLSSSSGSGLLPPCSKPIGTCASSLAIAREDRTRGVSEINLRTRTSSD